MPIKLNTASGGGVILTGANTASDKTITVPAVDGTMNTSAAANEVPAGSASAPSIYPTGDTNTGIFFPAADVTAIATGGTERARITSGGAFLVGLTSVISTVTGPSIQAKNNGQSTIAVQQETSGADTISVWNSAASGNNMFIQFYTDAGITARGSIDYNRGAGQVRYNITSDATLKNIIGDSDGQKSVEILNSTRIREYAWKDDEQQKPQIGVIAQELYETYKGAVSVGGDIEKTDEEGNVTTEYKPWGVDKTAFTFHLIAGWQAHEKMIQELKAEIAALKGNA